MGRCVLNVGAALYHHLAFTQARVSLALLPSGDLGYLFGALGPRIRRPVRRGATMSLWSLRACTEPRSWRLSCHRPSAPRELRMMLEVTASGRGACCGYAIGHALLRRVHDKPCSRPECTVGCVVLVSSNENCVPKRVLSGVMSVGYKTAYKSKC